MTMSNVLCIDEEGGVLQALGKSLREMGHRPVLATSLRTGVEAVLREEVDLIISDHRFSDGSGVELLEMLRRRGSEIPVIMMSSYSSVEQAVLAMRHGAVDYLTKPPRAEAIRIAVKNAIEIDRMRRVTEGYRRELTTLGGPRALVGSSPVFHRVLEVVEGVAQSRATILIEGESGTGKELIARAIHERSPREPQPFVTLNCAALPEGLVESALFGHERGAFTGATGRLVGAFERAHRGTLLLDEVSEMRFDLQSKLLRAIQEHEIERVGGGRSIAVDVRIVATTNRDLLAEVERGAFRRDLYYRLAVVPIRMPALRERPEDIPELVEHFATFFAAQLGIRRPEVTPEALESLRRRPWPGNVRELANAVERAVILDHSGRLSVETFGPGAALGEPAVPGSGEAAPAAEPEIFDLRAIQRRAIDRALTATGGHRTRAAQLLGISDRTLRNRLRAS